MMPYLEPILLIVDDDEATRVLLKEILNDFNVHVIETGVGYEGLNLFKKYSKEIVLVFLDIKLPNCSGWELIRQLKHENLLVPVIALSAMNPEELKEKHKASGFDSYLSKPFDIKELRRMVEFYLKPRTVSI